MFNKWKPYPKNKPSKRGWYQCSIKYGEDSAQSYVMDLFYILDIDKWKDNRRQNVFDTYAVYGYNDATNLQDKRLYTERICIRDDVVAFRKLPKVYSRQMTRLLLSGRRNGYRGNKRKKNGLYLSQ